MNWREFLTPYQTAGRELFSDSFLLRWGSKRWKPTDDDRKAAALLHIQIVSRITTQPLGYLEGVEQTALESIYSLFDHTRKIGIRLPGCSHFNALAWEVLNIRVRPFTAKWHAASKGGALDSLDSTDEFRTQLTLLQPVLRRFSDLLLHLRDGTPPPLDSVVSNARDAAIRAEMDTAIVWGISPSHGGIDPKQAEEINKFERESIQTRRGHYGLRDQPHAVALALSGGGIRSATFSLGVLVALAGRGILPQVDYLSTVSGGGYLGSFLTAFLNSDSKLPLGLRRDELPFQREDGEAQALRYIRHHCRYLSMGSVWERLKAVCAQLYGMGLNSLAILYLIILAIGVERWLRSLSVANTIAQTITLAGIVILLIGATMGLVTMRIRGKWQRHADAFVAAPAILVGILLLWLGLGQSHSWFHHFVSVNHEWPSSSLVKLLSIVAAIPVITSAFNRLFGRLLKHLGTALIVISGILMPILLIGVYLAIYELASPPIINISTLGPIPTTHLFWIVVFFGSVAYLFLLDVNFTSPHRFYRDELADAFLIQPREDPKDKRPFNSNVSIRLSDLNRQFHRGPYHLLNCALNVPGSKNVEMQGRLTDFFLFSAAFCGSPITGYRPTRCWERVDAHLDLGTAMAISGAAAAPQMGLGTKKTLSFWLALLNIRLGYWARVPTRRNEWFRRVPGLGCLLKEMMGSMDECGRWLNLTDGGHIENLGVYELLRRRCKYIIAVDGEEDSKMTFQALTTLQRLAAIDLGVRIDINLDDLRLGKGGLSRSHFRFCRVLYPQAGRGSKDDVGYLLYVKLSLTGNEGEFLRRYRLDDPAFPHDPTTNQFFTETQFEAYRSLGEHIGDKLFLRPVVGGLADSKSIDVPEWFLALGKSLLEPRLSRSQ
jgi:hypothetical protein